jgi:hypothetical protein
MTQSGSVAAVSPWVLAVLFLIALDSAITRPRFLWGVASLENTRDMTRVMLGHTYRASRMLYSARDEGAVRVALLGNSRIWIPAQAAYLEREIARATPEIRIVVDNLGIFGARLGDLEVLARHLHQLHPSLAILAISSSDLLAAPSAPLVQLPGRLLDVGWRDGPVQPPSAAARLDRWARTVWRFYRFHEFVRAAIADRLDPAPDPGPFPDRFPTTRALFDYMHGAAGAQAEDAYQAWRRNPTLDAFVAYLEVGSRGHLEMVYRRIAEASPPGSNSPSLAVLDALLAQLARGSWCSIVLLMPETPLLALDTAGRFHRPGFSDAAAALIGDAAARHHLPVVDARRWMPAEAFIDFDHLMPDLSGFQQPLAREIVRAIGS